MYKLIGGDGSPYSCKLRAYLRYRRIPFTWHSVTENSLGLDWERYPLLRARVIPVLVRPDGTYGNDSTPLLRELEAAYEGRPCSLQDPVLAFLDAFLEDFADEWCTKPMFAGRFHTEDGAQFGAAWQVLSSSSIARLDGADVLASSFASRQRGRRSLVGCGDWDVMERTIREVCEGVEAGLRAGDQFLFGDRPTAADFALFGQMRQWAADPLPSRVMHGYPGAWGWVWRMDDLSGYGSDKPGRPPFLSAMGTAVLSVAVQTYVPFMTANSRSAKCGEKTFSCVLFRQTEHSQPVFKYQVKCWDELRSAFGRLTSSDQSRVEVILRQAGVEQSPFIPSSRL